MTVPVPTALAVALLSLGSRRLLAAAREVAVSSGAVRLEGLHLFLAAARLKRSKTSGSLPQKVRLLLAEVSLPPGPAASTEAGPFLPLALEIEEACCELGSGGSLIPPGALLGAVFSRDRATRQALRSILGDAPYRELEALLSLPGFSAPQRRRLLGLRQRLEEGSCDDGQRG